jgi:uncharacterized protein (TIGR02444 family)
VIVAFCWAFRSNMIVPQNRLWRFSLEIYAAPGVAAECLALQDRIGADVNVLLFCAWLGWRNVTLAADDIASICHVVDQWQKSVVLPLRSLRQFMREMPEDQIMELRKRISADELEAERIEQAMLFRYAETRWPFDKGGSSAAVAQKNLLLYIGSRGHLAAMDNSVVKILAALTAMARPI